MIEDSIHEQLAEMSEIEFRIWIADKIKKVELGIRGEIQKLSQEFNEFKDKMEEHTMLMDGKNQHC